MTEARVFAVQMGFDAMRICLGMKPKNHSASEVLRWMHHRIKRGA